MTQQPLTRSVTVVDVTCGLCEQGGQFDSPDHVSRFKEDHFEWSGHDDWFEIEKTVRVPVVRRRRKSDIANDMLNPRRTA